MAITTRPDPAARPPDRDDGPQARDLSLSPPPRRMRVPELAIGVLVIVVFALGGVLWHLRSVDKAPALAVASSIQRGETIEASDLRVTYVASDDPLARLDASDSGRVVGMTALVDLAPGSLVTEDVVAENPIVGDDQGVVGLALEPGQFPSFDIAPGDLVNVVRISGSQSGVSTQSVVAESAQVTAVRELAGGDRRLVSLLAAEEDADDIASYESASLRLVQVSS